MINRRHVSNCGSVLKGSFEKARKTASKNYANMPTYIDSWGGAYRVVIIKLHMLSHLK